MGISLIITIKNEENSIYQLMDSILKQNRIPDEIIIVDGGSTDNTLNILSVFYKKLNIKLFEKPCNIAKGRNIAISLAKNEIIAVTDAGCILDANWLENITNFDKDDDVLVGNYQPIISNAFDISQYSLMGLFKSDDNIDNFVISSRSIAFKKKVWEEIGGYPEWLNFSEDMFFHNQIKKGGYNIKFEKNAIVRWKMRENLKGIFKQYFRYMEGDGIAKMHTGRHILRLSTYLIGITLFIASYYNYKYIFPLLAGYMAYLIAPFIRLIKLRNIKGKLIASIGIPFFLVFIDMAKIAGYFVGIAKGKNLRK
jgi:glycosyltransferase involved in cell wall biosynthesis